ncbi:MAG: DedA family protein [Planctomycetaceae bacterium]|nr:DedA family protein [Planctomycetaceae bacterium]
MYPTVLNWLNGHGYPALAGLLAAGVFGLPVPDETLLVYAGLLSAQGVLNPVWAIISASLGSWCGISVSYVLGRTLGHKVLPWVERHMPSLHRRVQTSHRWFAHAGRWTLTLGYFIPGVRHATAIVAGALDVKTGSFMAFAYPGGAAWVTAFILLGYYLGQEALVLLGQFWRVALIGLGGVVLLGGFWALWRWLGARRK